LNRGEFAPGRADEKRLNSGDRPGTDWLPAECDVSIRPGWFYHEKEDDKVRSSKNLVDLYFASVGRGASFHLNLPVDRRGQIHSADVNSLLEFRRHLDATFRSNLARGAVVVASNTRRRTRQFFSTANLLDLSRSTFWTTDDGLLTPELIVDFTTPKTFNVVRLREFLPLGQRVESFAIDEWKDGSWREFARGTSIGNCRLTRTEANTTTKIRVRITKAAATPALSEIGVFAEPK
jgi:alpha-L-fucosidase